MPAGRRARSCRAFRRLAERRRRGFCWLGERGKSGAVPDILSVLQHRQADGALLVGVELLVIQAHLQVLGYSLQRHSNYCRVSSGGVPFFLLAPESKHPGKTALDGKSKEYPITTAHSRCVKRSGAPSRINRSYPAKMLF